MKYFSGLLLFATYVGLSLFGLYKLKAAPFGANFEFILGFLSYASGFGLWLVILRMFPLSLAFPIAAGALIIGTQLVGVFLLGEEVFLKHMLGVTFILLGMLLLG